jgi:ferric-dicitrate binding protein FerR (iron transport regulator)
MQQLQSAYNIKYRIDSDEARNARLTGTFEQQDILSVFKVIEQALDIKISQDADGTWTIDK